MRAFIVGNGPSLKKTDLALLKNDISFGCNRISQIYPYTTWRPTHYVRAEEPGILPPQTYRDSLDLHIDMGCSVWVNPYFCSRKEPNVHLIVACAHYLSNFDEDTCPTQWHFPQICSFGSSANVAIQIAVKEGYAPIYLIGCDLGYKDGAHNHFADTYENGLENSLRPALQANLNTFLAHVNAARSSPVKIYNATIGGELEVYERVKYAGLFP